MGYRARGGRIGGAPRLSDDRGAQKRSMYDRGGPKRGMHNPQSKSVITDSGSMFVSNQRDKQHQKQGRSIYAGRGPPAERLSGHQPDRRGGDAGGHQRGPPPMSNNRMEPPMQSLQNRMQQLDRRPQAPPRDNRPHGPPPQQNSAPWKVLAQAGDDRRGDPNGGRPDPWGRVSTGASSSPIDLRDERGGGPASADRRNGSASGWGPSDSASASGPQSRQLIASDRNDHRDQGRDNRNQPINGPNTSDARSSAAPVAKSGDLWGLGVTPRDVTPLEIAHAQVDRLKAELKMARLCAASCNCGAFKPTETY